MLQTHKLLILYTEELAREVQYIGHIISRN